MPTLIDFGVYVSRSYALTLFVVLSAYASKTRDVARVCLRARETGKFCRKNKVKTTQNTQE